MTRRIAPKKKSPLPTRFSSKDQQTYNKKVTRRVWLVFFALVLLIPFVWYYAQKTYNAHLDREKFAKIETLVNDVKSDLEKTYPNKQWSIVKYCQAARTEFGSITAISCTYGVKGATETTVEELSPVVGRHAESKGMWKDYETTYEAFNGNKMKATCSSYPTSAFGTFIGANFSCDSSSSSFLYPEIPR